MLILGDLLIDRTVLVRVPKLSPEAPVPVAMMTSKRGKETPGGAGLAAAYAARNHIPINFVTACTQEKSDWLKNLGMDIFRIPASDNITKIRYIDIDSGYHLLRIDNDLIVPQPCQEADQGMLALQNKFFEALELSDIKVVAFLDYCKGFLSSVDFIQWMIETCRDRGILTYADSRSEDLSKFRGIDILKLNYKEYEAACGALNVRDQKSLLPALNLRHLIVTNGGNGAHLFGRSGESVSRIPNLSGYSGTPDVTGCGDVFDVNFCYHWGMKRQDIEAALGYAVDKATKFAYEAIEVRLGC